MNNKPQPIISIAGLVIIMIFLVSLNLKTSHASPQAKDNMEALKTEVPLHRCGGPKIVNDGSCAQINDRPCSDINGCDVSND